MTDPSDQASPREGFRRGPEAGCGRVLATVASGCIGGRLVQGLLEAGYAVRARRVRPGRRDLQ